MTDKHVVPLTLLAQTGASFGLALALGLSFGQTAGLSALLGGAAAVVPNAFLAARVLKPRRDVSARAMMQAAWIGEIGKVLLTVLMFAVIFGLLRPITPLAVFGGFIAAQLCVLGALLLNTTASGKEATTKS